LCIWKIKTMDVDFKRNVIRMKELPGEVSSFFIRKSGWVLALVAVLLLGYLGFLWYAYVTNPQWSETQKQEYISTRESAISFDQKGFNSVISEIEKRKSDYDNRINDVPDIFRLK
jgi:hypothetical protein